VGVDSGMLDLIQKCLDLNMASPWACSVCTTVWTKITKEIKQVANKAASNENRIGVLESSEEQLRVENADMKSTIKKLEDRMTKVEQEKSDNSGEKMLEEISERGSRERNIVCHNCPESDSTGKEEIEEDDWRGVQGLLDHLGTGLTADRALLGVRRLGKTRTDETSRPLLLIFRQKSDRDLLLEKAPRLSKDQDEYWRKISVVADLTKKQRELEQSMFKRAEERNLTRSTEEQAKNLCHKVLGRRGERVIRVVELREWEMISGEGKVIHKEESDRGTNQPTGQERSRGATQSTGQESRKRSRSPGTTPPARRTVRAGRGGGRFGRGQRD
jgi:hypothetical protein